MFAPAPPARALMDGLGRRISYLRLSVTDRCDLRCRYCMGEQMTFAPRATVLNDDEIARLVTLFVRRGTRKLRLTGGEPLTRRGMGALVTRLGEQLGAGLDELTMTTNGTRLAHHVDALRGAGVRRVNVSLDTLDGTRFATLTRGGRIADVLAGIAAARAAGLAVKINAVALAGVNEDEIEALLAWCAADGHDLTLIETMPLGDVEGDRMDSFLPLSRVRARLEQRFTLLPEAYSSGGPARYVRVAETGQRLGFISPLTNNFCAGCNRVRVTATGMLHLCLGHDAGVDLGAIMRGGGSDAELDRALDDALQVKPARHDFRIDARNAAPALARHMSVTGG